MVTAALMSVAPSAPAPRPEPRPALVGEEKNQQYWAKGTGFGTGSTMSNWDSEQTMMRKKSEEEHVTCLIQVLASFINPSGGQTAAPDESTVFAADGAGAFAAEESEESKGALPSGFAELMTSSCLVPAVCAYLRNDSGEGLKLCYWLMKSTAV